jgi:SAM-dependent methyltransferase
VDARSLITNERAVRLARRLPAPARNVLKNAVLGIPHPRWGNLRRTAPFSDRMGSDRGTPVDRVYIEAFLAEHAADVRGRVLEIKDAGYTRRFGGEGVTTSDVVDVEDTNPEATVVADLALRHSLPEGRFDCFVMTQTLQYVDPPEEALQNAWRALAPGGVLLLTVPALQKVDFPRGATDLWRWTPAGLQRLLERVVPGSEPEVYGYGNLIAATAWLMGLAAEELEPAELELFDPEFVILSAARLVRRA